MFFLTACDASLPIDDGNPTQVTQDVRPTVLVLTPERYTYPDGSAVADLIIAAGGQNAAAGRPGIAEVNTPLLLEMNPDIILFTKSWTSDAIEDLLATSPFQGLNAVQRQRIYHLDFPLTANAINANRDEYLRTLRQWFELV